MTAKKCKLLLGITAILLILLVLSWRIVSLNKEYPNPRIITYKTGEYIKGGDISIMVTDSKFTAMDEIKEMTPGIENPVTDEKGNLLTDEQKKVLLVNLNVHNLSDEIQTTSLLQFMAQSDAWSNGADLGTYYALNNTQGTSIQLQPGEQRCVQMPFYLYEIQFDTNEFQKVENRKFNLVLSVYPIKNVIELE